MKLWSNHQTDINSWLVTLSVVHWMVMPLTPWGLSSQCISTGNVVYILTHSCSSTWFEYQWVTALSFSSVPRFIWPRTLPRLGWGLEKGWKGSPLFHPLELIYWWHRGTDTRAFTSNITFTSSQKRSRVEEENVKQYEKLWSRIKPECHKMQHN